jgi:ribosomal protein S18 acetylase RimI-like enzyme
MNVRATPSPWESDVLGVRVGVLSTNDAILPEEIIRAENNGLFDVVFVKYDGWLNPSGSVVALDHLYDMEAEIAAEKPNTSSVSVMCFPSKKHLEIAMEAFPDSRFLKDPRLAGKSSDRYVRWLSENQAYVPTDAPDEAFLVTQVDPDGAGRISLIAVASGRRSAGLGTKLVTGVLAMESNKTIWRVRVSAENERAIRFYKRLGFCTKSVSTIFHVWVRGG